MKKVISLLLATIMLISSFAFMAQAETTQQEEKRPLTIAYITPWNWSGAPDPTKLDVINYCFASVDITTHKVVFNSSTDINYLNQCLAMRIQTALVVSLFMKEMDRRQSLRL